jgi:hypothetical protein
MKDLFMAVFEGLVSIFERNGAAEIRRVSSGGYLASEVKDLMGDLLECKLPVSKWSLWIDGIDHKQADTYTGATLKKLATGNTVELIAVKRRGKNGGFMAPVIKITGKDGIKAKPAANKARLGR